MSDIAWLRSPKKDVKELIGGSANQKRTYQDKSIGRTNQSRSPRRDKARFSSNQIRLAGRQSGGLIIQDRSIGSANQNALEHPADEPSDIIVGSANHVHQLDYLRTDILWTDHPSDRIVGSTNHVHRSDYLWTDFLWTDHPSDESSAQPITSIGWIIFGRTFFVTNQKPSR